MDIGKVIRGIRNERESTLEQVAFDAGTDASNLSRIERGKQHPSMEMLKKIAAALGTTAADIYALAAKNAAVAPSLHPALDDDYSGEAVELRRHYHLLTAKNRRLVTEYVKLLYRLQESDTQEST